MNPSLIRFKRTFECFKPPIVDKRISIPHSDCPSPQDGTNQRTRDSHHYGGQEVFFSRYIIVSSSFLFQSFAEVPTFNRHSGPYWASSVLSFFAVLLSSIFTLIHSNISTLVKYTFKKGHHVYVIPYRCSTIFAGSRLFPLKRYTLSFLEIPGWHMFTHWLQYLLTVNVAIPSMPLTPLNMRSTPTCWNPTSST